MRLTAGRPDSLRRRAAVLLAVLVVIVLLTLVSPDDPNATSQPYRFGVTDEAGKINLNAVLALDKGKGDVAKQMLMALPGMTDEASDSIIDWLDSDDTPRSAGAESDYYGA